MQKAFFLALSFLTRIPTPAINQPNKADQSRSVLFYPLVGLIIGVCILLPVLFLTEAASLPVAAIMVVIWAAITGGLHLDGVGDSADAWLGGTDAEKTHKILKDPVLGSAGVITIVLVLILKVSAIAVLLEAKHLWVIIAAPVFPRALVLLLFLTTPYVRNEGLGSAIAEDFPNELAWPVLALCAVLALLSSFSGLLLMLLGFWSLRRLMLQRLRGFTGDTAGASIEFGEVFWLLGVALSV